MSEPKRWRWTGTPGEEQPDVGDILCYVEHARPDWFHLVHDAKPVRGRGPEHLWLMVTRFEIGEDGSLPQEIADAMAGSGRLISAIKFSR